MKTAGSENPNHGVALPRNRAPGAVGQNKSRSIKWAEKQEKFQPKEMCFFLTSPFIDAGSKDRRNTCAQFTRWSLKAQSFSRALV
jgi:hypothetical protein